MPRPDAALERLGAARTCRHARIMPCSPHADAGRDRGPPPLHDHLHLGGRAQEPSTPRATYASPAAARSASRRRPASRSSTPRPSRRHPRARHQRRRQLRHQRSIGPTATTPASTTSAPCARIAPATPARGCAPRAKRPHSAIFKLRCRRDLTKLRRGRFEHPFLPMTRGGRARARLGRARHPDRHRRRLRRSPGVRAAADRALPRGARLQGRASSRSRDWRSRRRRSRAGRAAAVLRRRAPATSTRC